MADHIKNNPIYLRSCIVFEVASEKPIFDCYKNFCQKLGRDAMEYEEFQFWFMKFSRGEMDLKYDRSQDAKSRTLNDMPIKILDVIVQKVPPNDVLALRLVSKDLKAAIDQIQVHYKTAFLQIRHEGVTLKVNEHTIIRDDLYEREWDAGMTEWEFSGMFHQMYPYLKNPNVHFKTFHLEIHNSLRKLTKSHWIHAEFVKFLKNINYQVTSVRLVSHDDDNLEYLKSLEPGTLREIRLGRHIYGVLGNQLRVFYNAIVKTEQWKHAKVFKCEGNMDYAKIEDFANFESFEIRNWQREEDGWEKLANIVHTNTNFKKCRLTRSPSQELGLFTPGELASFKFALGRRVQDLPSEPTFRRFLLKDGAKEFEIGMCDEFIEIERKD